jgi:hypothetical protein
MYAGKTRTLNLRSDGRPGAVHARGLATVMSSSEWVTCDERDDAETICTGPGLGPFGFNSLYESPNTGLVYMCRERSDQMPLG